MTHYSSTSDIPAFAHLVVRLHPDDPIAIAVQDIEAGTELRMPDGRQLAVAERIPAGHKVALCDIAARRNDPPLRIPHRPGDSLHPGRELGSHP